MIWVEVGSQNELFKDGMSSIPVEMEGRSLALFLSGDNIFAYQNMCPHKGAPLTEGEIRDGLVICPWHGWQLELNSGQMKNNPKICLKSYPVKIKDGKIFLELD
jgi:NAD(P)H-dependent nitrite reductase small subunit